MPDAPNNAVQNLLEKWGLSIPLLTELDKKQCDGLIVLDTSAYALIKPAREWNLIAIIDHHRAEGRDMEAPYMLVGESSPATAEIVANILHVIDKKSAYVLALGIISDTARFKSGRAGTFSTLSRLMNICRARRAGISI